MKQTILVNLQDKKSILEGLKEMQNRLDKYKVTNDDDLLNFEFTEKNKYKAEGESIMQNYMKNKSILFDCLKLYPELESFAINYVETIMSLPQTRYIASGDLPFGINEVTDLAKYNKKHISFLIAFFKLDDLDHETIQMEYAEDIFKKYKWCNETVELAVCCATKSADGDELICDYLEEEDCELKKSYFGQFLKLYVMEQLGEYYEGIKGKSWIEIDEKYDTDALYNIIPNIFPDEDIDEMIEKTMTLLSKEQLPTIENLV